MGEETQENVFLLVQKTFFLRASSPNLTCAVGTSDPICTIMWTRTASAFSVTDSSTCVVAAYVPEPAHASVSQFGLQLVAPPHQHWPALKVPGPKVVRVYCAEAR